jgi:hypothetical protein
VTRNNLYDIAKEWELSTHITIEEEHGYIWSHEGIFERFGGVWIGLVFVDGAYSSYFCVIYLRMQTRERSVPS